MNSSNGNSPNFGTGLPPVADCIDLSPSEYSSLTPTQRLMYIVKKTDYSTNQTARDESSADQQSSPSRSSTQPQPSWTGRLSNTSILRSERSPLDEKTSKEAANHGSAVGRKRVTWKDIEQDRPCQGRKRPRSEPTRTRTYRIAFRPEKRLRFSDTELVTGPTRSGLNVVRELFPPVVSEQRRISALFPPKETVKQQMIAERWNVRLAYRTLSPMRMNHDASAINIVCRNRGVFER